jgi:hypothetical protein
MEAPQASRSDAIATVVCNSRNVVRGRRLRAAANGSPSFTIVQRIDQLLHVRIHDGEDVTDDVSVGGFVTLDSTGAYWLVA